MAEPGNKPLFILWIKPKNGKGTWTQAGAVFNGKFDMGLVINPGIVLTSDLCEKNWLTLKPFHDEGRQKRTPERPDDFEDAKEGDIPF